MACYAKFKGFDIMPRSFSVHNHIFGFTSFCSILCIYLVTHCITHTYSGNKLLEMVTLRKEADKNSDQKKSKSIGPHMKPGPGYYPGTPSPSMELARAYVPIQRLGQLYTPAQALETGTLFPELYRPYPY